MERLSTTINKEKVLKQIIITRGNIELATANISISRTQFYYWLKNDLTFRNKYIDILKGIKQFIVTTQLKRLYKKNPIAMQKLIRDVNRQLKNNVSPY